MVKNVLVYIFCDIPLTNYVNSFSGLEFLRGCPVSTHLLSVHQIPKFQDISKFFEYFKHFKRSEKTLERFEIFPKISEDFKTLHTNFRKISKDYPRI